MSSHPYRQYHPSHSTRRFAAACGLLLAPASLVAQTTYTWSQTAGGGQLWTTGANWVGGVAPSPVSGDTVDFSTVNIAAATTVTLGADRTAELWRFGDTGGTTAWVIGAGSQIILAGTTPTIQVNNGSVQLNSVVDGSSGLRKTGSGDLILNASNTFTGGIQLNAGRIVYDSATPANAWGDAGNVITFTGNATMLNNNNAYTLARGITINPGVIGTMLGAFGESTNVTGPLTGSGTMRMQGLSNNWQLTFSNTGNLFTGPIEVLGGSGQSHLTMNSLADSTGSIRLGNTGNGGNFIYGGGAISPLVLNQRQFIWDSTTGGNAVGSIQNNASLANTITVNTDLSVTAAGNKTFTLSGSNTGFNAFNGIIPNGPGGAVGLDKTGAGIWALGGANSYSGVTLVAQGSLIFRGATSVSPGTAITLRHLSGNSGAIRLLDDSSGTISLPNTLNIHTQNVTGNHGILVGNNNTANGGSSSGTTTGSTFSLANLVFNFVQGDTQYQSVNVTGANGYNLRFNNVVLNNLVSRTAGATTESRFNPTSASLSLGNITMANGNTGVANDGVPVLVLAGSTAGNEVTGVISDAADAATGQVLSLLKNGASTWTLSGPNTYSGNTTVSVGTLRLGASNVIPNGAGKGNVTVTSSLQMDGFSDTINGLSGAGTVDGLSGTPTLTVGGNNASSTFSGTLANSGGSLALAKIGNGTLTLSGALNTYSGETTISGGTVVISNANSLGTTAGGTSIGTGATLSSSLNGLLLAENITAAGGALNADAGLAWTVNGTVSGSGNLIKRGAGTVTLSNAANNQTGRMVVEQGTLRLTGAGGTLGFGNPAAAADAITLGGLIAGPANVAGTLRVSGGNLSPGAGRGLSLAGLGGTLEIEGGNTMTLAANIAGSAPGSTLTKAGSGTFNLTGNAQLNALVVSGGVYNQQAGTTTIASVSTGLQLDNAVYNLDGGKLRTDRITLTGTGAFNWGAILAHRAYGVGSSLVDHDNNNLTPALLKKDHSPSLYSAVSSGTELMVNGDLAAESTSTLMLHGSPSLYLSGNVLFDNLYVDGDLDIASGAALEVELSPYLLRPVSQLGASVSASGSLPLVIASGSIFTNTAQFAFSGVLDDGRGFVEYTGSFTNAFSLPLNSWYLEYASGVPGSELYIAEDPLNRDAGTFSVIFFHYNVAGYVPEPSTLPLLGTGIWALRLITRRRRDADGEPRAETTSLPRRSRLF